MVHALTELQEGEVAVVVHNHCATEHASRLAELGLTHGEQIQMIRRGSPMLLQIGESRLCLRSEDVAEIAVLRIS